MDKRRWNRARSALEQHKRHKWNLHATLYTRLEVRMAPRHIIRKGPLSRRGGLQWRNHLTYRIWHRPHHFTQAGLPTIVSDTGRRHGLWPWETRLMTFDEIMDLITKGP